VKPLLKPLCRIAAPIVLLGAPSAFADESDIEGRWLSGDKSGWRDIGPIDGKPEGRARRRWSAACGAGARECSSRSQQANEAVATPVTTAVFPVKVSLLLPLLAQSISSVGCDGPLEAGGGDLWSVGNAHSDRRRLGLLDRSSDEPELVIDVEARR